MFGTKSKQFWYDKYYFIKLKDIKTIKIISEINNFNISLYELLNFKFLFLLMFF